jgi:hypothetical protein
MHWSVVHLQVRESWPPPTLLRPFIATRELVLRRSWRREVRTCHGNLQRPHLQLLSEMHCYHHAVPEPRAAPAQSIHSAPQQLACHFSDLQAGSPSACCRVGHQSPSVWSVLQDDGTVLVLYSSTTHHKCRPQPRAWWQWFAPIRASVRCVLLVIATARCHALHLAWDLTGGIVSPKRVRG